MTGGQLFISSSSDAINDTHDNKEEQFIRVILVHVSSAPRNGEEGISYDRTYPINQRVGIITNLFVIINGAIVSRGHRDLLSGTRGRVALAEPVRVSPLAAQQQYFNDMHPSRRR